MKKAEMTGRHHQLRNRKMSASARIWLTAIVLGVAMLADRPAWGDDGAAGEWSADIANLSYYPHANRWTLSGSYAFPVGYIASNSRGSSTTQTYDQVTLGAVYGLPSRIRLGLSINDYTDQTSVATSAKGDISSTSLNGLSAPSATFAWRYKDDASDGIAGDLGASFLPSYGPRVAATTAQTGNNLPGGDEATATTSLFWHAGQNELEGTLTVAWHAQAATEGSAASSTAATDSYWSETFALNDRVHFGPRAYAQAGLSFSFPYQVSASYASSASKSTSYASTVAPTATLGFAATPHCAFTLAFAYRDGSSAVSQGGLADIDTETISDIVTLGARAEF